MFRRVAAVLGLLVLVGIAVFFYTPDRRVSGLTRRSAARREGGSGALTATLRAEPPTFNRFASQSFPTHLVSLLADGRLVRVNPETDRPEPWLAERITATDTTLDITLRPGLRFSDGTPATADDVVWSLKAAYATPQGGIGDALRIDGAEIQARAESPTRVVLTLPRPWAPAAAAAGGAAHLPARGDRAGAGRRHVCRGVRHLRPLPGPGAVHGHALQAGERIVLARNPHYWRKTARGRTAAVPGWPHAGDRAEPERGAAAAGQRAGGPDCSRSCGRKTSARSGADADAGRVVVTDVGRGLDRHMLWFNLGPAPIDPAKAFLREDAFRQAVSLAVDRTGLCQHGVSWRRRALVRARAGGQQGVDRGRSCRGPPSIPAQAATLLDGLELRDRDNDGLREDAAGRPVRFAVLVQSGITAAQTAMSFVRDALANVGVGVDIVALDLGTVMTNWQRGKYDAVFHYIQVSDTDPASNLDFWLSRGPGHLWHPAAEDAGHAVGGGDRSADAADGVDHGSGGAGAGVRRGAAADADAQPGDLVRGAARVRRDAAARGRGDAAADAAAGVVEGGRIVRCQLIMGFRSAPFQLFPR